MGKENPSSVKHIHPFLRHTARTEDSHIERIYACGLWPENKDNSNSSWRILL